MPHSFPAELQRAERAGRRSRHEYAQGRLEQFQPDFFVSFQPGDPVPKTFVVAISEVADAVRLPVQNSIATALPNISIINVAQIVERVLDITDQKRGTPTKICNIRNLN